MKTHGQRGFSLVEMLTVVAIIGMFVAISMPSFDSMRRRSAVRAATEDIRAIFRKTRARAITRSANAGLKFSLIAGRWMFSTYDDGDGDGLRNDDITAGIDRRVSMPQPVLGLSTLAAIGLPRGRIADPDGGWMRATALPVQFGNSTICSFSPTGSSTPGSVYISDRAGNLYAVRMFAASAKVRVLRYDFIRARWEER